jgi:Na+-transporting methylmalonyl-CoA/oxaloacetate decarboxylase gamma subunit
MYKYMYTTFAQSYGNGAYSSCTYNCASGTGTNTGTAAGNSNPLANTGVAIAGIVTLACLIIFIALIVRIIRKRPAVAEEAVATEEENETEAPADDTPRNE